MNTKELTEIVGLSRDTIRFYEREGLILPPSRTANGYRDYTRVC
ncbi:MerR family DNA-binding transcriptional regulator [Acinetobacter lwoffii]|nr:MerR family DNA-binding transcriptional regulator [Acinetobacter lwoffii]